MAMLLLKWIGIIGGEANVNECLVVVEKHRSICQPINRFSLTDCERFSLSRLSFFLS